MNEVTSDSMLSFVASTLCCEAGNTKPRIMPRVVPDQRATFENDELFRKLSRECEVSYFELTFLSRKLSTYGKFRTIRNHERILWD